MLISTFKSKRISWFFREKLEESVSDLRSTTSDLQERLHSVDGEGETVLPNKMHVEIADFRPDTGFCFSNDV